MSRRIEALYDVTFRVPSTNLGTVLDAMKGAAYLVTVKEHTPPAVVNDTPQSITGVLQGSFVSNVPKTRQTRYVGGIRSKGITGPDLVNEIFADGKPRRTIEVADIFVARGFARTSALTDLNKSVREKRIKRIDFETWIKYPENHE